MGFAVGAVLTLGGGAAPILALAGLATRTASFVGLLLALVGLVLLSRTWPPGSLRPRPRREGDGRLRRVLRFAPAPLASIDPALVGAAGGSSGPVGHPLRVLLRARGADGVVVVTGSDPAELARVAWWALRADYGDAVVYSVRPPDPAGGPRPIEVLARSGIETERTEVVVWIDDADRHLGHDLTAAGLTQLRAGLPGALVVLLLPWSVWPEVAEVDPALSAWLWRAVHQVRAAPAPAAEHA
ncbi:MAG: hypothetical protein MUE34_08240 [Acidimicrobiales bacterium]|nr:hypothetical protein [Acidimicrobiales bacterium]